MYLSLLIDWLNPRGHKESINLSWDSQHTLYNQNKEARGVMVKVIGNGLVAPSSNPGRGISLSANTLGKGMNSTLPPAMGK